jgi:spore coat protein U-like protein
MRGFVILSGCLGAAASATAVPVQAGTASATLEVSFTVLPSCSLSAEPLAFAGRAGSPAEAEAAIDVRCTSATVVAVALDQGRHAAGSQRRLVSQAGQPVPYAIYSDAARSHEWSASSVAGEVSPDRALRLVAYGRIEPGDTLVAAGGYSDSVTVTVAF